MSKTAGTETEHSIWHSCPPQCFNMSSLVPVTILGVGGTRMLAHLSHSAQIYETQTSAERNL